jgi:type II secretory pathway component PulC
MRVAFLLLLAGCATVPPAEVADPHSKEASSEPAEAAPAATAPPAPSQAAAQSAGRAPGVIARRELAKVLDASPGMFLQHVDSEARFVGGRFAGWKLVTFFPGDARFAGVDLHAGDVVTRVNGNAIERPEQLMDLWKALRSADELVVDLERGGAPRTLRWKIAP